MTNKNNTEFIKIISLFQNFFIDKQIKTKIELKQNVSTKINGLKDLSIETYDNIKGRPSLIDVDN